MFYDLCRNNNFF